MMATMIRNEDTMNADRPYTCHDCNCTIIGNRVIDADGNVFDLDEDGAR